MRSTVYRQNGLLPLQFQAEFAQDREDCGEAGEHLAIASIHSHNGNFVPELLQRELSNLVCSSLDQGSLMWQIKS